MGVLKMFDSVVRNYSNYLINLISGFLLFLIGITFFQNETSYDKHWKDSSKIFLLQYSNITRDLENIDYDTNSPFLVGQRLTEVYSFVKDYLSLFEETAYVQSGEQSEGIKAASISGNIQEFFPLNVLIGDLESLLTNRGAIAISSNLSTKLFSNENPIGKYIEFEGAKTKRTLKVVAVYEESQLNTTKTNYDAYLNSAHLSVEQYLENVDVWQEANTITYLKLPAEGSQTLLQDVMPEFIDKEHVLSSFLIQYFQLEDKPISQFMKYKVTNIEDVYLQPTGAMLEKTTIVYMTLIASSIALFVTLLNFLNSYVVGVLRKTHSLAIKNILGQSRSSLTQELTFPIFATIIAAFSISVFIVHFFNDLIENTFGLSIPPASFTSVSVVAFSIVFISSSLLTAVILNSVYRGNVLSILNNSKRGASAFSKKYQMLSLAFQITLTIVLLTAVTLLMQNINKNRNHDFGFEADGVAIVHIDRDKLPKSIDYFSQLYLFTKRLLETEGLKSSRMDFEMFENPVLSSQVSFYPGINEQTGLAYLQQVDVDYFEVFANEIVLGSSFNKDLSTNRYDAEFSNDIPVVVNRAFASKYFDNAEKSIGKQFKLSILKEPVFSIIGVSENISYGPNSHTAPIVHALKSADTGLTVHTGRYAIESTPEGIAKTKELLDATFFYPAYTISLVTEIIAERNKKTEQMLRILLICSIVSFLGSIYAVYTLSVSIQTTTKRDSNIMIIYGATLTHLVYHKMKLIGSPLISGLLFGSIVSFFSNYFWVTSTNSIPSHWEVLFHSLTWGAVTVLLVAATFVAPIMLYKRQKLDLETL